ncbi:MAG TPA: hypothetical protein VFJ94_12600, partial [Intrasporangium sp.]|nr:hypothetical protein [Intrasporangium sp.]
EDAGPPASDETVSNDPAAQGADDPGTGPQGAAPPPRKPTGRRSGRPSVPSWDDIVFGRRPQ